MTYVRSWIARFRDCSLSKGAIESLRRNSRLMVSRKYGSASSGWLAANCPAKILSP
jgi:hypothetical protein